MLPGELHACARRHCGSGVGQGAVVSGAVQGVLNAGASHVYLADPGDGLPPIVILSNGPCTKDQVLQWLIEHMWEVDNLEDGMELARVVNQERSDVQLLPRFEVGPDHDRDLGVELHEGSADD